jgi:hypothetical protein
LVAELEDRGVTVEIDPDLLVPRHPLSRGARAAAAVRPRSEAPPPAPPARPVGETSGSAATASSAPARRGRRRRVRWRSRCLLRRWSSSCWPHWSGRSDVPRAADAHGARTLRRGFRTSRLGQSARSTHPARPGSSAC